MATILLTGANGTPRGESRSGSESWALPRPAGDDRRPLTPGCLEESLNWKLVCTLLVLLFPGPAPAGDTAPPPFAPPLPNLSAEARRGEHLVVIGGCHDCHTPLKMGPNGPVPDMSRMLSGHPEQIQIESAPAIPPPWMMLASGSRTAFVGPWGTSFSANLTPDRETGLGDWTEQNFIEALRTARHRGRGRPILPPMPVAVVGQHTDSELKAIWAYLRRVPAIRNQVPPPRSPAAAGGPPPPSGG